MNENKIIEFCIALSVGLVGFFAQIEIILYVLGFLIIFDNITAILRDIRKLKDEMFWKDTTWLQRAKLKFDAIKSGKIRKTGLKLSLYLIFVMVVYAVEVACVGRGIYIANFAAAILMFSELKSIAENIDIILDKDIFTSLIAKVKKKMIDSIHRNISDEDNSDEDNGKVL